MVCVLAAKSNRTPGPSGRKGHSMDDLFKTNSFMLQMISSGEYVNDDPAHGGDAWTVRVYALRLNAAALDEWRKSQALNHRNTYKTAEEWEAYQAAKEKLQADFKEKIAKFLDVDLSSGSLCVTQSLSEVFTAVHTMKKA